jgi:hypothetical protein
MRFEDVMKQMGQMSEEERKAQTAENMKLCICAACPTYVGTGESKVYFCSMGKSEVIKEEKGCTCPECPVTARMGLRWEFYCTRGAGREQMASESGGG